jgi:hypothetical protein
VNLVKALNWIFDFISNLSGIFNNSHEKFDLVGRKVKVLNKGNGCVSPFSAKKCQETKFRVGT